MSDAPRLTDPRLPPCDWNTQRRCYEGAAPAGPKLVVTELGPVPIQHDLDHVAAMYAVAMHALPRVPGHVARRLEARANGDWSDGRGKLTLAQMEAKLVVRAIALSGDPQSTPTLWLDDGDLFWGHAIEVSIDIEGRVTYAEIVG
jgi:hypothetical protein